MSTSSVFLVSIRVITKKTDFNGYDIKKFRQNLNMTQEDFAHKIGVTFATVYRWERGHHTPSKGAQNVLKLWLKKSKQKLSANKRKAQKASNVSVSPLPVQV